MPLLRWSPAVLALSLFGSSTCRGKSDPGDAKPPVTSAPEVALSEVDTSSLTPRERREWAAQVAEVLAPCKDVPVSIAQCVREKRPCRACLPAAQFLLKQVQAGKPKKDREDAYAARFDPSKVKTIVTEGSPELGAPDAVVTMVEWADFQCPHCRALAPLLEELVHRFEGQVKLVFKFYPLSGHPRGEPAARAALAAQNQGKFWEMHHLIFENQVALEQADLEKYAKQIGLDMAKFRADLTSKETGERIAKDKNQADGLGLQGTPLLYIDGREVDLSLLATDSDLEDWVKLDIELAGKVPRPKAAVAGAGSATPVVGSAATGAAYPPKLVPTASPAAPSSSAAVPSLALPKK
jgi:protein-disulfide isomerase